MRLSKKSAHRIIVSMGLVAPIVYLFGSLFFGLNGAHGTQLWAEDINESSYIVDADLPQYIGANGFVGDSSSYRLSSYYPAPLIGSIDLHYSGYFGTISLGLYDSNREFISRPIIKEYPAVDNYADVVSFTYDSNVSYFRFMFGNSPSINIISCSVSYLLGQSAVNPYSFNDYSFGQFFAKDNFLMQWGENVISDNPVGFAPFATFIKFFDSSIIHGADSQIALMMYGQLYYMLHIMLFDLVYHVLVFIPNLITSVFNKFGGGLNDE